MAYVVTFGGKTLLGTVSRVILYQSNTMLVGYYLGIESLAIFARSRSLVLAVDRILNKVGLVFAPKASFLNTQGNRADLQKLLRSSVEYSLYLALPAVLLLTIMGEPILQVWMGARFVYPGLLAILALGHLVPLSQAGTYHILLGMGRHGLPALAQLLAAICGIALAILFLGQTDLGLIGAAIAIIIPITVANAIVLPLVACRLLGITMTRLFLDVSIRPICAASVFAVVLLVCRMPSLPSPAHTLILGLTLGSAAYGTVCWHMALTPEQRSRITNRLPHRWFGRPGKTQ